MAADSKETTGNESVLSRWSRRKHDADLREASDEVAEPDNRAGLTVAKPDETAEAPEHLTDADMPDIDTLNEDSDFSGFMSPGVSDELRNLALRKLFHAPVFNIRDGLDEYDEDYTSFEKLGDIVTCDMKHQIEMQEKKLREAMEQEQQAASEAEAIEDELTEDFDEIEEADLVVAEEVGGRRIQTVVETGDVTTKVDVDHE